MVDIVIFDLFGVIAREQSSAGKKLLEATADTSAPVFWEAYWGQRTLYDRGEVTGPEYWRRVAATLGTTYDDSKIARLIGADLMSWNDVDDEMISLIEGLAASGQRIGLLSNIPEELAAHYEENHRWLKHFNLVAFSCRIGHTKPQPDAYLWCCRSLGLAPERVLFVDDRVENIQAAEAIGMSGHLFVGLSQARQALTSHGATGR
jgi:putative hydrolase of the HAD superfamily